PLRPAPVSTLFPYTTLFRSQATLFVTPGGQSLLIDTGWPGNDGRDADRIVAAARKAAINKIDFVLVTHFHQDHAGGLTQLAARIDRKSTRLNSSHQIISYAV